MYVIYEHKFPNGKKYVGITMQKPEKRWSRGKNYSGNLRLSRAIEKYGWDNIEHNILAIYATVEEAGAEEQKLIAEGNLQDPQYGYNISSGGEHGKHSDETKQKLSKLRKGSLNPMYGKTGEISPRYGCTSAMKGKHLSEYAKAKISEANSGPNNGMYGKHLNDDTKEKIRVSLSGCNNKKSKKTLCVETGVIYNSTGEAARLTGCHQGHISSCCKGSLKTTGGYHWRYVDG